MNEGWIKRESRTELEQLRIKLEKSQARVAELEDERDEARRLEKMAYGALDAAERDLAAARARVAELEAERDRLINGTPL